MTIVPSFTWAGGILSKGLWGRPDLNKYATGLAWAENVFIGIEGGADKRPGFYYVGKPKFQNKEAKLVRWRLANDDSYALEFGDEYIRFIRFGGYVMWPVEEPITPHPDNDAIDVDGYVEVPVPYKAEDVGSLKFTFANDIVYIFHKNYPPAQLRRLSLYQWDYVVTEFNPHEAAPTGLAGVWQRNDGGATPNWQTSNMDQPDYAESPENHRYKISATMPDGLETLASAPITVSSDLGNRAFRNRLTWDAKPEAVRYTIYKSKSGLFGFVGYVDAPTLEFIDNNIAPSYDVVPVIEFEGFGEGVEEDPELEFPRVGEFRKQRLVYAATGKKTQSFWFSRPLFFTSMSTSIPVQDDDAIISTLVGRERHTINHMIELKEFFFFTDTAEWVLKTTGGAALTQASIDPVKLTAYGADADIAPIPIGNRILFAQGMSGAVLDMGFEFTADDYKADDLTRLARDLFRGKTRVGMVYAHHPNCSVWSPMSDGTAPVMTYVRQHEIWGWSVMTTQGQIFDVCSTPEFDMDAVYIQVKRTIAGKVTRVIERLDTNYSSRIEEMNYVDCSLSYENSRLYNELIIFEGSLEIEFKSFGTDLIEGEEVQLESATNPMRFIVTEVADFTIRATSKRDKPVPADFPTEGLAFRCGNTITGFDHLANTEGNWALADGVVFKDIAIDEEGKFILPIEAARVHAGIPYYANIHTLGIDVQQVAGQMRDRTIQELFLRVENSRGIYAGPLGEELQPIDSRSDEDYDEANKALDGVYKIPSETVWDRDIKVHIQSRDPLPMNIRNLAPDLQYES